ncbi:hypothetical protein SAMN05421759_11072 [Roseivivax lentus]|uniref:Tail sheath protein C-terminal domain-containing protein n=1 Tax=Roseivivax lentus TaxID=633194 RepID=A0A1N7NUD4_9RHOB|nr:phage tail sheath subtilisin-like domain-containing protein [Roseivivax lentus]SIT02005.1 hypothetical protein SAMN05421759_11072 [Roseivivax lentus]
MFDTPGVYVREIPSGVRSISGVATSNTAFVGVFARGPLNEATRVTSFGEFERIFGGVFAGSEASYAVRHYFLNGGNVAFIVRVAAGGIAAADVDTNGVAMTVTAVAPGADGNRIAVGIAHADAATDTFQMLVRAFEADGTTVATEEFFDNLSTDAANAQHVETIVNAGSTLVRVQHADGSLPARFDVGGSPATNQAEIEAATPGELLALAGGGIAAASVEIDTEGAAAASLTVAASSVGSWGDTLRVGIAHAGAGATSFDLVVREFEGTEVIREEAHLGVTINAGDARYVETVVAAESEMITVQHQDGTLPERTVVTGAGAAADFNALLEAPADDLAQLGGGNDGTLPGNTDAWRDAVIDAIGGDEAAGEGIFALDAIVPDVFNLMCLPDLSALDHTRMANAAQVYQAAHAYCTRNFAFLIVDVPEGTDRTNILAWTGQLGGTVRRNAALYYPKVTGPDVANPATPRVMPTSGIAAGLYARTDAARGVWKAPAGTAAGIAGGTPVDVMTNRQQGPLNQQGINAIRTFPVYNSVIWGARTLDGADALASEWRYIPVRRLALFIEHSLFRGLQWVVFEPNDEPLWSNVRLNVNAFMSQLHRQGAFQGASARDAYLVKCDSETTTQADINLGILNIYVGFAPVRPAEFVVLKFQQLMQSN